MMLVRSRVSLACEETPRSRSLCCEADIPPWGMDLTGGEVLAFSAISTFSALVFQEQGTVPPAQGLCSAGAGLATSGRLCRRPCLLLVTGVGDLRHLYADELEDEGYQVLEAWDQQSAATYLRLGQVDLLVMDVNLDGGRSLELLDELAKRSNRPPVLLFTVHPSYRSLDSTWTKGACESNHNPNSDLLRQVRTFLDDRFGHRGRA